MNKLFILMSAITMSSMIHSAEDYNATVIAKCSILIPLTDFSSTLKRAQLEITDVNLHTTTVQQIADMATTKINVLFPNCKIVSIQCNSHTWNHKRQSTLKEVGIPAHRTIDIGFFPINEND